MKRLLFMWLVIAAALASVLVYVLAIRPQAAPAILSSGGYCSPTPSPTSTFIPQPTSSSVSEVVSPLEEPISSVLFGVEIAHAQNCTPLPTTNPNGARCSNGSDDDSDRRIDMNDPGCYSPSDQSEDPNPQCSDGKDNDNDGRTDQQDPDCYRRVTSSDGSTVVIYYERDDDERGNTSIVIPSPSPTRRPPSPTPKPPSPSASLPFPIDDLVTPTPPKPSPTPPKASPSPTPKASPTPSSNARQCGDSRDNDNDGKIDYPKDYGCSSLTDNTENDEKECGDGKDNDNDGLADNQDRDCYRRINGKWQYVARTFPERGTRGEGPPAGADQNDVLNPSPSPSGGVTPPGTNPSPTPSGGGGGGSPTSPTPTLKPAQVLVTGSIERGRITGLPLNSTIRINAEPNVLITARQAGEGKVRVTATGGAAIHVAYAGFNKTFTFRINETKVIDAPIDVSDPQQLALGIPTMMGMAQQMVPKEFEIDIKTKTDNIYPPYIAKLHFQAGSRDEKIPAFRINFWQLMKLSNRGRRSIDYRFLVNHLRGKELTITTMPAPQLPPGLGNLFPPLPGN